MLKRLNENANAQFITVSELADSLNLGSASARKVAAEANAIVKIGKSLRIDRQKCLNYVRNLEGEEE